MSTDDNRPETLTVSDLAEDLTLSNEEGTSWFGYDIDRERDLLLVNLYGDTGEVIKRFEVTVTITETPATPTENP